MVITPDDLPTTILWCVCLWTGLNSWTKYLADWMLCRWLVNSQKCLMEKWEIDNDDECDLLKLLSAN